jgi:thiol-disulfide isomerase/thioredoxin
MNLILLMTLSLTIFNPSHAFAPTTTSSIRNRFSQISNRELSTITTSAAATLDNSQSYEMSSFAKRMKNIIKKDAQKSQKRMKGAPKNLMRLKTLEDFKKVVGGKKDQIVVVRWYAPWCKACKAIAPSFYRLAATFPDAIFVDVPVTPENANLHQGLGVPSLPYGHIYHPTGKLVEEVKISKKYFPDFAKVLKTYIDNECPVVYDDNGVLKRPRFASDQNLISISNE